MPLTCTGVWERRFDHSPLRFKAAYWRLDEESRSDAVTNASYGSAAFAREDCMMSGPTYRRGALLAGILGAMVAAAPAAAQQPLPPGSPLLGRPDSEAAKRLAPVAPPPLPTPADKLPLAKLKAPAGF